MTSLKYPPAQANTSSSGKTHTKDRLLTTLALAATRSLNVMFIPVKHLTAKPLARGDDGIVYSNPVLTFFSVNLLAYLNSWQYIPNV